MQLKFIHIHLDKAKKTALSRQIYEKIRDDILQKKLLTGTRLPATRGLAKELSVSRNVVMEAYDQLHAEGYIESRSGSYTRVAPNTWYKAYQKTVPKPASRDVQKSKYDISFETGVPDLKFFPRTLWAKYLRQAVATAKTHELAYHRPEGIMGLRRVLCDYLYQRRGLKVDPGSMVITSGATQALFLTAKILYADSCEAVIEDPGGFGVVEILKNAGFHRIPVKTGNSGMHIETLNLTGKTKLVYTTPSHQFPLGSIMPAARRIQLLELLKDKEIYIVEDDYDSEFRYDGAPIHPFKALDPEKVIYIGSFSKVLSPSLRIGYAILPKKLLALFKNAKRFSDAQSPLIDQIALKRFIEKGDFERHVFKMKKGYQKKRDLLIRILKAQFENDVEIFGENAGLHLVARFKNANFEIDDQFNVCHNRVLIPSVEKHALNKGKHKDMLVFGYGNLSEKNIVQGIRQLNRFNVM